MRCREGADQVGGKNRKRALLKAGFSESQASHDASEIINRQPFIDALVKLAGTMTNKEIGALSKGSLIELLGDKDLELRTRIQAVRIGLEVGGEVGATKELVMRHTIEVPPAAQEMIARRMLELQQASAITVEAVNVDAS
jgi:hypothetical protein